MKVAALNKNDRRLPFLMVFDRGDDNGKSVVLSKILEHVSIQVTLDSYATVIDSMMLQNVQDLKDKSSSS